MMSKMASELFCLGLIFFTSIDAKVSEHFVEHFVKHPVSPEFLQLGWGIEVLFLASGGHLSRFPPSFQVVLSLAQASPLPVCYYSTQLNIQGELPVGSPPRCSFCEFPQLILK